jgi:hypothetical protein
MLHKFLFSVEYHFLKYSFIFLLLPVLISHFIPYLIYDFSQTISSLHYVYHFESFSLCYNSVFL